MRRAALISFIFHLALVLAAIIALPPLKLDSTADESVSVDLVGPSAPQEANAPGKVAAPANTPTVNKAPLAEKQPKPQPIVAPPPPPPPPPPAPEQKPVLPTPPAPAPAQSPTHQQHVTKNPAPLSKSVLNTLLKLQALQKQEQPPTARYNPDQGGAPNGGGSNQSTANSGLTGADRDAIGNHVRPCWTIDSGAPGVSTFSVELMVTTDATGTVRNAVVAPQDQGKLSDPIFNAYAQRAVQAVMNYQCATLPLPSYMLGQNQTFLFDFTP